ncbi:MAG: amidohydrolase family protein, partial [Porticoccaceae bacterium]|nr:amidohydrolase family protein [Porticoccaceae bacterium]
HATHINKQETKALAHSGATVGLCPTTEANLGDGLFPLRDFLDLGGHIAIGSDGNTCTSPLEEMRLLEYGQRLISHRRNISSDKYQRHTGMSLFSRCRQGGARSIGQPTGMLQEGCRADLLVLDDRAADLRALPPQFIIDTLIFAPNQLLIKDVMANGKWYVKDFQSINQVPINTRYMDTISKLRS